MNSDFASTSIVLCTFNGAHFLRALWDSLLAQSRLPDEICVRDDVSIDDTWPLLNELAQAARARGIAVSLARNERNSGVVANFEAALQNARGDVIHLCDQDDVWHPRKLETMHAQFARRPRLLLLHGDARLIDENGVALRSTLFQALELTRGELRRVHTGRAFDALLRRNLATGATLAFRRALLKDALPMPREWVHDEWLAMLAAVRGEVDCIEAPLIDYRQHAGNQIGVQSRDFAMKIARAAEPRRAYLLGLIDRMQVLLQRLRALRPPVDGARLRAVESKLAHLQRRAAMPDCHPCRLPAILREAVSGGYWRYARGCYALAYDLFGRG